MAVGQWPALPVCYLHTTTIPGHCSCLVSEGKKGMMGMFWVQRSLFAKRRGFSFVCMCVWGKSQDWFLSFQPKMVDQSAEWL